MKLIEVNSPATIRLFHKVSAILNHDDPQWVPYIHNDIEKIFDVEHYKIFKEGGKAIRWVIEDEKGNPLGRIAAFINPRVMDTTNFKTGGIGFFESVNDQKVANFMFDTCRNWLKNNGMEAMDGPINFGDRNQFWGCQISNFDEPPIYQMNYSRPYHRELFEAYGFGVYFNQYMYWRDVSIPAQEIFHRKYNQMKDQPGFRFRDIKGMHIDMVADHFATVYNGAWGGHSHFKPMTQEAARKIFRSMKKIIDPEIVIFLYHDDVPVAFYVNLPELNQVFRYMDGTMGIIDKIKFLYYTKIKRVTTRMTGIAFGVIKEWQGKGLEAAMIVYGEKTIGKRAQYKDTVLTWIGDFNPKMMKVASNLGATIWRSFITYRYQFDRTRPFERAKNVE
ncbi:hypothetical protein BH11BAC2_BH11BAC2_15280 [soil metagenome]